MSSSGASDYERLTGQRVKVERGTYRMIQGADAEENLFFRFDDMDQVYLDQEDRFLPMEYAGNLTYQSLVQGRGFDNEARYMVNDPGLPGHCGRYSSVSA